MNREMDANRIEVLKEDSDPSIENVFFENNEIVNNSYNKNNKNNFRNNKQYKDINCTVEINKYDIDCHGSSKKTLHTPTAYNTHNPNIFTNNYNHLILGSKPNTNHHKSYQSMPIKRPIRHNTQCTTRNLNLISLVFGLAATGSLSLAASTDFWLYTNEPFKPTNDNFNSTLDYPHTDAHDNMSMDEYDYGMETTMSSDYETSTMLIQTHSGLWRICIVYDNPGSLKVCSGVYSGNKI